MNIIDSAALQTTGISPDFCTGSRYSAALASPVDSNFEYELERRVQGRLVEMGEVKGVLDACTESFDADPGTSLRAMEGLAALLVTRLGDGGSEAAAELNRIQEICKRLRANFSRFPGSVAADVCRNRRDGSGSGSKRGVVHFLFYIGLFALLFAY